MPNSRARIAALETRVLSLERMLDSESGARAELSIRFLEAERRLEASVRFVLRLEGRVEKLEKLTS